MEGDDYDIFPGEEKSEKLQEIKSGNSAEPVKKRKKSTQMSRFVKNVRRNLKDAGKAIADETEYLVENIKKTTGLRIAPVKIPLSRRRQMVGKKFFRRLKQHTKSKFAQKTFATRYYKNKMFLKCQSANLKLPKNVSLKTVLQWEEQRYF